MTIAYNYQIISVDEQARCMEIVYTAEGRQPMHIGARLPYTDETLEAVVEMYSPVAYWLEQERTVQVPVVGTSGTITPTPPTVSDSPQQPVVEGAQTL